LCARHKVPGLNTTTGASDLVRLKEEKIVWYQYMGYCSNSSCYYSRYHKQAKVTQTSHRQASRQDFLSCEKVKNIMGRHQHNDFLSREKVNITGRHRDKDILSCDSKKYNSKTRPWILEKDEIVPRQTMLFGLEGMFGSDLEDCLC